MTITTFAFGPPTPQETTSSVSLILRSTPLTGAGSGDIMTFTMPINPSEVRVERPSRQTVTQTLGGAYQDHWGEGLIRISMAGNTGWRRRGADGNDGYQSMLKLRDILREYDARCARSGRPNDEVFLYLLLDLPSPRWERFRVSKESASYDRTRSQPLLYMYTVSFIALEDLSYIERIDPSPVFIITSYPLAPPPVIVVAGTSSQNNTAQTTGGPGSGNSSGTGNGVGTGTGTGVGTGLGTGGASGVNGGNTGTDTYLDPGVVENTNGASNDWAATNGSVTLKFAGYYIGPGSGNSASTLRDLATMWFGSRGWRNAGIMWPVIRDTNPEFFLPDASGDTHIPALAASEIEASFSCHPDHLRIPLIRGEFHGYDADRYMRLYNTKPSDFVKVFFQNSGDAPGAYWQRATISESHNTLRDFLSNLFKDASGTALLTSAGPS